MSDQVDTAITHLEEAAVRVATDEVMKYLVKHVWRGFAYPIIGPLASFFVSYISGILMERLDWVTYMVVQNWKVTNEGKDFVKAAEDLQKLDGSADAKAIEEARKAKEDSFKRLIGLAS